MYQIKKLLSARAGTRLYPRYHPHYEAEKAFIALINRNGIDPSGISRTPV